MKEVPRIAHAENLERFFDALNTHDMDCIIGHFAADGVFCAPFGPAPSGTRYEGRAQLRQAFEAAFQRMPDVAWLQATHVPCCNKWLSEWVMQWTADNGQPMVVQGCDIFVFDGGLIVSKDTFLKQVRT
jgi:ketosteroid isomerase-like protein